MTPLPSGGRRLPRPGTVQTCSACGEPLAFNYPSCPSCCEAVERYWEADWRALLHDEGIHPGSPDEALLAAVVALELETQAPEHAWTIVDAALKRLSCPECGSEPGTGPPSCTQCEFTFGNLWGYDLTAGPQGVMTSNEHALRVGRWVVRAPHRHSDLAVLSWRLTLPRLLVGWLPSTRDAQRARHMLNEGRVQELLEEFATLDKQLSQEN